MSVRRFKSNLRKQMQIAPFWDGTLIESVVHLFNIFTEAVLLWLAFRYYTGRVITVKDELLSYTTLSCSAETVRDAAEQYKRQEPNSAERSLSLRKHIWVLLSDRRVQDIPYWIQERVGLHRYTSNF